MLRTKRKIKTIDLFAGCGGLLEGFEKEGSFETLACVEWDKSACDNLKKRLTDKWNYMDADKRVVCFDIQRAEELFSGFSDTTYGNSDGLDSIIKKNNVDLIIGGPPCQAYSLAGRIRDKNGMRDDYRNYLFESYLKVVNHYRPKLFIFENVPGMLSASPDGTPIISKIRESFENSGYKLICDFKEAIIDLTEYGIPQNRKRIIILGVNTDYYKEKSDEIINYFYKELLPQNKKTKKTVREAIGDLPKLLPSKQEYKFEGKKYSHLFTEQNIANHIPRFHSKRDIKIFNLLAQDISNGDNKYTDIEQLKELYFSETGKQTNVHKYYVIRWDEQSNTIPAHLYKDGLRHIHPDHEQSRSITVREAARLQTFDDDYEFIGGMMQQYKMIGNAVPPVFSNVVAQMLKNVIEKFGMGDK